MGLKSSFCTIAYRKDPNLPLAAMLEQVSRAGYQGVEIWWPQVEKASREECSEIRDCVRGLNLFIPMLSPYLGNFNLEMTNRDEMLERMRAAAPVAEALGSPLLRAFAGWTCECSSLSASEAYWRYNLEGFREMARIAEAHGVEIAIETHSGTLADSVAGILRIKAGCGPRIKVNLQLDDIAVNSGLAGGAEVYHALGALVVHTHMPIPFEDPKRRADYSKLLAAMQRDGFKGFVSIEHCGGPGDPFEVAQEGQRFLASVAAAK